jgi:UDPglucose--hexose-1-phosphate uridylyltransferase
MPELRKDPVVGRWVIISTERSRRPTNFSPATPERASGFCPFCPGHEDKTPPEVYAVRTNGEPPNGGGWSVRVVPNKFPALQIEGSLDRRGEGLYDKMNGVGAHEVVIESPVHDQDLADLPLEHIEQVLMAYRARVLDLQRDRRFRYVLIFKNHGDQAGATLEHTHTQLIATPIIPKSIQEELEGARRYYELKERCVFCDIVQQESTDAGRRLVSMNDRFLAMEPFAPRFPFETWILPRRHDASFETLEQPEEMRDMAWMLKDILGRLNRALNRPPFNLVIHTSPVSDHELEYYHWHIEILPKLTRVAGFEIGSGFYINPTPPEDAAQYLRGMGG